MSNENQVLNENEKAPEAELDDDEPLTIEKHLLEDVRGGVVKPNPAPDRGPYPGSEIF
jgi:hypothetical protein